MKSHVYLGLKRTQWQDWKVTVTEDNKHNEEASYYTDDRQDAVDTAQQMKAHYLALGYNVELSNKLF
jgi:hypothetical protein